jgi:hypothetical protein
VVSDSLNLLVFQYELQIGISIGNVGHCKLSGYCGARAIRQSGWEWAQPKRADSAAANYGHRHQCIAIFDLAFRRQGCRAKEGNSWRFHDQDGG